MKRIVNKVGNLPCIFLLYFYKIFKINNLDFACKKTKISVLRFWKGKIDGLLGENDVSKTTLLKLIYGLQGPLYIILNVWG